MSYNSWGASRKRVFEKCVRRAGSTASHAGRRIFFQPLHMLNIQWEVKTGDRVRVREGMERVRKKKKERRGRGGRKGKGADH